LGSVVVAHPFHPLSGQRLVVVFERRCPVHGRLFVCEAGPARRVTLPIAWTDRAPGEPLAHRLSEEGLATLAELVAALQDPRPAGRDVP
jgi:predicted ATPase